ncbi:hypothetical protein SAMN06298214_1167 [Bacteroidales bacterium WCE2004]|nr:hypothetical protein SAMN06298214_1167 [Bacteroidales bacterium WCE2004]
MDIELLSRMVGELIVKHDQVGLPGVGTFVAEMVPATFSDKGYTINPPYRRLSFYPGRLEDTLLIDLYAESNQIAREAAKAYVTQYLAELRSILEERKTIVLPGLGRLRATRENTFFFIADEGLDIFPAGVGLQPVSLKTHALQEEPVVIDVPVPTITAEPEPVAVPEPPAAEPVAEEPAPEPEPAAAETEEAETAEAEPAASEAEPAAPETEEAEAETEPAPAEEPAAAEENADWQAADWTQEDQPDPEEKKPTHWGLIVLIVFLVLLLLAGAFILVSRLMPGSTDFLLYSPEEIKIINF